jgi:hypothetical protein
MISEQRASRERRSLTRIDHSRLDETAPHRRNSRRKKIRPAVISYFTHCRSAVTLSTSDRYVYRRGTEGGLEMDVGEPRARRRGFFLHSDTTGEVEVGEQENPEGFIVRVRIRKTAVPRQVASTVRRPVPTRVATGRSRISVRVSSHSNPQIRSGSVTGSRQRAHLPR